MKVEATKTGYFGLERHREGDQFDIPDEPKGKNGKPVAFSKNWMRSLEPEVKAEAKVKAEKSK